MCLDYDYYEIMSNLLNDELKCLVISDCLLQKYLNLLKLFALHLFSEAPTLNNVLQRNLIQT